MADIIRLFDKNETNFDHYETVIDNCISCRVVQEWNGMYSLTMTTPIDNRIVEEKILKVPTPKNEQLFRIASVTKVVRKGEYAYNVYARHITYDLLDDLLLDIRPTNATQKVALDAILNQSENTHSFTGYSDVTGKHTANYVRMNPIQAIMGQQDNSLLNLWGGNLERDNFNFRINATSVDRGFTVELGKNLVGITETIDISEVTTRLYPTIVIEDPTVTKLPEKYVDSPLIGNYKSPNIKELRLDLTDEQKELPLTELYQFMRAECQKQYDLGVDKPTVNYEIDFVSLRNTEQYKHLGILEQVDISDTIHVKVDLIGVDLETQVIKYEYDSITEKFIKIQLGNFKPTLTSQTNDIKKLVDKTIRESDVSFSLKMKAIADRITGNNGGYQIIRLNNLGEPYETLWMDTPNVDTATNVMRINQQGIAGSNNGINGPYDIAMTIDGAIAASDAVIMNLESVSVTGDVINIMSSSTTFDVGTGTGYYADFSQVLNAIGNRKHIANGVKLTINIRSVLNETILIEGFSGGGSVEVNIYNKVNGFIRTSSNTCHVLIIGRNSTHVVSGSGDTITSSADSYVSLSGLNVDAKDTASGIGIISQDGSNVYVQGCDIINCRDALYSASGGKLQAFNNKGNAVRFAAMASSGRIWMRGTIPDGGSYGFVYTHGTITGTPSSFSPPATQTVTETRTFNQTDIYTYSVQYGARSAHYGKAAAQNRWDTSMTQMKGRISFGSSVYSFINGRNSGTSPTVKIRLRRQNSTHGQSASVKPTPEWSGAPSFGGATRGNWTPWVTIPYTLFTSSGYTFSFYNGTTGSSYAIWDRAEVQITRTITQ